MTKHDKEWNLKYEQLVEFKRDKGNCLVPHRYKQDKSLGLWVSAQRTYHNNDKLRLDRKTLLDEIGFAWKGEGWDQQYEKLVEFKRKNGHCMVPNRYQQDKSLGIWVGTQRNYHQNGKLRLDRKIILDEIGFAWKGDAADVISKQANDKLWHQLYEKLVEFKRKDGHCLVPHRYKQDPSLGKWVSTQRSFQNNNKLRLDRKRILDALDFIWNVEEHAWHLEHEKLVAFKRQHQHCLGPFDKSLSIWVDIMRKNHANKTIRPERKELLDELEFVWNVETLGARSSTTDIARGLVIESLQTNGSCLVPSSQGNKEDTSLGKRFEGPSPNTKLQSTYLAANGR
jgi:uncharacterized protein YbgA (DUF1722 family)